MTDILNISAYRFTPLTGLPELRQSLFECARSLALKGTILLAEEGINLFLAGPQPAIREFIEVLQRDPRLADLDPKESWSATQPFRRLRVRLKREIIRMDHPTIRPAAGRADSVTPDRLKNWLDRGTDDEGRPVVMLDTRNGFEVDHGAFDACIDWRLSRFGEFPGALQRNIDQLRDKTVVSYCTGGIRCEKAAILMRDSGLANVYQLEGGILRYFEQIGGAHYHGDCFVFDEREALSPDLRPTRQVDGPSGQ